MTRRVLLFLSQAPQDPSSGAARSLRTIAKILAAAPDFSVRAVGSTATDRAAWPQGSVEKALGALGLTPRLTPIVGAPAGVGVALAFDDGGVATRLADVGDRGAATLDPIHHAALDALLEDELSNHRPDLVLTFGGRSHDHARRSRARVAGAKIVFGLRQWGYLDAPRDFFTPAHAIDHVLAPSEYLIHHYRKTHLIPAADALPPPLDPAEVLAPEPRSPLFVTTINPSQEKGVFFTVRLLEQLASRRPDLPLLVVESRGTRSTLLAAARAGGIDLGRFVNIHVAPPVASPRDLYAHAKLLLVPSVWDEPAGRVASEAMLNGVPPLVSDRGGLPEQVGDGGIVLPLPAGLTTAATKPVSAEAVAPWITAIERLCDNEAEYLAASDRARLAGRRHTVAALTPAYSEIFRRVARLTPRTRST